MQTNAKEWMPAAGVALQNGKYRDILFWGLNLCTFFAGDATVLGRGCFIAKGLGVSIGPKKCDAGKSVGGLLGKSSN